MKTPIFIAFGGAALLLQLLPYLPEMLKGACLVVSTVATVVHLARSKRSKAASRPRKPKARPLVQSQAP